MDKAALEAFLADEFPQAAGDHTILRVAPMALDLRLDVSDRHLRPGGTVSGPAMFGLADVAFYLALLAMIGPQALAVTTGSAIDFMRKPEAGAPLVAEARILKLGRLLAVGDVLIRSGDAAGAVARASMTYAIPPEGRGLREVGPESGSGVG
ncbi:PaaI family thioesterase [Roseisalinus antarcticus]|uniref:Thioesterase superfamily protein n=1 Tax=Roseisalinus antarcticus TaxID=254357 RepID=A0A1Y5RF60_9RHOB|nr:PaaI family thioesterase [Roseisalinus antarcticus]SLN16173.1 Thioesterase superfamily protein [Roseisalinus antarcticus]